MRFNKGWVVHTVLLKMYKDTQLKMGCMFIEIRTQMSVLTRKQSSKESFSGIFTQVSSVAMNCSLKPP